MRDERERKRREESVSLKTFRSSMSSKSKGFIGLGSRNRNGSKVSSKSVTDLRTKHKVPIWPLKFEKPERSVEDLQMSVVYHSKDLSQNTIETNNVSFF